MARKSQVPVVENRGTESASWSGKSSPYGALDLAAGLTRPSANMHPRKFCYSPLRAPSSTLREGIARTQKFAQHCLALTVSQQQSSGRTGCEANTACSCSLRTKLGLANAVRDGIVVHVRTTSAIAALLHTIQSCSPVCAI